MEKSVCSHVFLCSAPPSCTSPLPLSRFLPFLPHQKLSTPTSTFIPHVVASSRVLPFLFLRSSIAVILHSPPVPHLSLSLYLHFSPFLLLINSTWPEPQFSSTLTDFPLRFGVVKVLLRFGTIRRLQGAHRLCWLLLCCVVSCRCWWLFARADLAVFWRNRRSTYPKRWPANSVLWRVPRSQRWAPCVATRRVCYTYTAPLGSRFRYLSHSVPLVSPVSQPVEREGWRWVTPHGGVQSCSMKEAWVGRKFEVDVDIKCRQVWVGSIVYWNLFCCFGRVGCWVLIL